MNRSSFSLSCGGLLVVAFLIAGNGTDASWVAQLPRSLTPRERVEYAVESSSLVALARVISMAPDSTHGTSRPGWVLQLEPLQFLKGGIEGDRIDAFLERDTPNASNYLSLVGKPNHAAFVFLVREQNNWTLHGRDHPQLSFAADTIPQRRWAAAEDSMRRIVEGLSLDSTLARADFVGFVHVNRHHPDPDSAMVVLKVDSRLDGGSKIDSLWYRVTIPGGLPAGQSLVCLIRRNDGVYESYPAARTTLADVREGKRTRGITDQRLAEVKDALARIEAAPKAP